MKSILILFIGLLGSVTLFAQQEISVRVSKKSVDTNDSRICFAVEMNGEMPEKQLASQNYRIFYNSDNLHFDEESIHMPDGNEAYQLRLVQHKEDIDATGVGELPFESNLGFINYSIVLQDLKSGGMSMDFKGEWMAITNFCFEADDPNGSMHVSLAREPLTAPYGRAFIELSAIDNAQNISSLKVQSFFDYIQ